jgi:DNA-binding NtrC family response regulator
MFYKKQKMRNQLQPRIFIVDDDLFWIEIFTKILKDIGYSNVHVFTSGEACIENLHNHPEIIFLDYQMGNIDGISALKKIRDYYPGVFVIFTTGMEDLKIAVEAMKNGAFDVLLKQGVTKEEVEALIQRMQTTDSKAGKVF